MEHPCQRHGSRKRRENFPQLPELCHWSRRLLSLTMALGELPVPLCFLVPPLGIPGAFFVAQSVTRTLQVQTLAEPRNNGALCGLRPWLCATLSRALALLGTAGRGPWPAQPSLPLTPPRVRLCAGQISHWETRSALGPCRCGGRPQRRDFTRSSSGGEGPLQMRLSEAETPGV